MTKLCKGVEQLTDIQGIFASNVRSYRKKAHLSQEKLAEISGLHRTYIGGIEQQRINVSLKNIGKIAAALNVDPAVLFLDSTNHESISPSSHAGSFTKPSVNRKRNEHSATSSAAVVVWAEDEVSFQPIEPTCRDLTVHVLTDLIARGYTGGELVEKYKMVTKQIDRFLSDTSPSAIDTHRKQTPNTKMGMA